MDGRGMGSGNDGYSQHLPSSSTRSGPSNVATITTEDGTDFVGNGIQQLVYHTEDIFTHFMLEAVSMRYADSKTFVDLPLKCNFLVMWQTILDFSKRQDLGPPDSENMMRLWKSVEQSLFFASGSDLVQARPDDWVPTNASLLPSVTKTAYRKWVDVLHTSWLGLCKKRNIIKGMEISPSRHTMLHMPRNIFVPGSRFQEQYYWDSYFTVKGLLASKMLQSAVDVALNLLYCIDVYGHVPNGTRSYYLNRTQPPLLSQILVDILEYVVKERNATEMLLMVLKMLRETPPLLIKEHKYMISNLRTVRVRGKDGRMHELTRYNVDAQGPRAESFKEDMGAIKGLESEKMKQMFSEIATMAESGWDFSSRWLKDHNNFQSSQITSMIPVDLNVILARMEANIGILATFSKDAKTAKVYLTRSKMRAKAIQSVMWNEEEKQWKDLVLERNPIKPIGVRNPMRDFLVCDSTNISADFTGYHHNPGVYASNWFPLWMLGPNDLNGDKSKLDMIYLTHFSQCSQATSSLRSSGLVLPGGVATSLYHSGHQWDYPNAWAPIQSILVDGLMSLGTKQSIELGRDIVFKFLKGAFKGFMETGEMHEKYNARFAGRVGDGGEYPPQIGFGWTNGVCLDFLMRFGDPSDA